MQPFTVSNGHKFRKENAHFHKTSPLKEKEMKHLSCHNAQFLDLITGIESLADQLQSNHGCVCPSIIFTKIFRGANIYGLTIEFGIFFFFLAFCYTDMGET